MSDIATGSEPVNGVPGLPLAGDAGVKRTFGYCADCGTWDGHGRFCTACGYDFTPESETRDTVAS